MNNGYLSAIQQGEIHNLAAAKLLNIRFDSTGKLAILKYSKRAFWKKAWNQHPLLMLTRGMIVEWETGRIVAMPFTKVFNWGDTVESETLFNKDEIVIQATKVNGFLAIATWDEPTQQVIITSSGTFDSDFADMARLYLANDRVTAMLKTMGDTTFMFEICHPSDPHIVPENEGAHLIGARAKELDSVMDSEFSLDQIYEGFFHDMPWIHRPAWFADQTFGQVASMRGEWEIEGYMIRGIHDHRCLKIKSTHYLTLKFLSRSNKVDAIWDDPDNFLETVDEDFHEIVKSLPSLISKEGWYGKKDQERLQILNAVMFPN